MASCPQSEQLTAWSLGKLPAEDLDRIAQHVAECKRCHSKLEELDSIGDDFVNRVRQARPAGAAAAVDPQLSRLLRKASELDTAASLTPEVTSELPTAGSNAEIASILKPSKHAGALGQLGGYRVLAMLGEGGMGIVFQAEDEKLRRRVALKTMKAAGAQKPISRERFLREARAMAAVSHPHIVTIFQVGEEDGVPYLAMELLPGETLERRIVRNARAPGAFALPLPDVLRIAREVAEALFAAHARGLIHRDIKPANIWLREGDDCVKVLDFGLARIENEDVRLTQTGVVVGTPAYMAPEQANGQPVDARTDLFSLGSVLYCLCTGTVPFQRSSAIETLLAVTMETPKPLREVNPRVPAGLAKLVDRLLAKKPDDRPATAKAVCAELDELIRVHRISNAETTSNARPDGKSSRPPARNRLLVFAAVVAVLVAVPAVFVATRQPLQTEKGRLVLTLPTDQIEVFVDGQPVEVHEPQLDLPLAPGKHTLRISGGELAEFVEEFELKPGAAVERTPALAPSEQWFASTHALRVHHQARAVGEKLAQLNPGFDSNLEHLKNYSFVSLTGDGKFVTGRLTISTDNVTNISPVAGIPHLRKLECLGSAPGKGKLRDLTALKNMKLEFLDCRNNAIDDFSVLKDTPLIRLFCDNPEQHLAALHQIATLNRLNGNPVPWKR